MDPEERAVQSGSLARPLAQSPSTRFEGLEAYRAITAIALIVFHAYQYSREGRGLKHYLGDGTLWGTFFRGLEFSGWFFVLSGFLVALPFIRAAVHQSGQRSPRGFLVRRAIRIIPPYYLAIIVVWTWRFYGSPDQWVDLVQHLTFTHIFDRRHIFYTIGPAWTLAIEVQFYLFLAVVGGIAYRLCSGMGSVARRTTAIAAVLLVLGIGSVAYTGWAFYIARIPSTNYPVYFGPASSGVTLCMGMLLAALVALREGRPLLTGYMPALVRLTALALILSLIALRTRSGMVDLYYHQLQGAAFLFLLASTVLAPRGSRYERILTARPLYLLGIIGYSIYLWHEPILIELGKRGWLISTDPRAFFTNSVVLVVLAIVVAAISYLAVERPFTYLRYLFTAEGRIAPRYPKSR